MGTARTGLGDFVQAEVNIQGKKQVSWQGLDSGYRERREHKSQSLSTMFMLTTLKAFSASGQERYSEGTTMAFICIDRKSST